MARLVPFHCTVVPAVNPAPLTESVNWPPPAIAVPGFSELSVGPFATSKATEFEVTPPDKTMMGMEPTLAVSSAGTAAVNWFSPTTVVVSAVPFHCVTVSAPKPLPFMVSVKAGPPAVAADGFNDLIAGPAFIVKSLAGWNVTPPEATVTSAVPGLAMSFAATEAVSLFGLTKLVGDADPFHVTTEAVVNPPPSTVRVKSGPPAVVMLGEIVLIVGPFKITKVTVFESTPLEFTLTLTVPGLAIRSGEMVAVSCVALTKFVVSADVFH